MGLARRTFLGGLAATAITGTAACSGGDDGASPGSGSSGSGATGSTPSGPTSGQTDPSAEGPTGDPTSDGPSGMPVVDREIATGLTVPWSMAFLPDGSALVSERDAARIVAVTPQGRVRTVGDVPGVLVQGGSGEGGLLGIALSPDGDAVYAYHTSTSDNRIVRMSWNGRRLGAPTEVLTGIPFNTNHDGGRLLFGPDGYLYASTGDALDETTSPDTGSLGGKILRLTPDGDPAPGNPFDNAVWSYGHRNVQGLAFDGTGAGARLWATEFGAETFDELNLIEQGRDYGWPAAEGRSDDAAYTDPVVQWPVEDCSPSGLAIASGPSGSVAYVCALQGEGLWVVPLEGRTAGQPRLALAGEHGRVRAAEVAPDGSLWVTTSNTDGRAEPAPDDDRILRLTL